MSALTPERFLALAARNAINTELLSRLAGLALPDSFLVAGSLYQAVWNIRSGRESAWGVKDYDVFYFDAADLSFEAEDARVRELDALTADLGVTVELRNQARVHLWYEQRFGAPCAALRSSRESIGRFLVACTCVGIEVATGALHAPHGLDELEAGILRMTPGDPRPALFRQKAESYQARWPWLRIEPADSAA